MGNIYLEKIASMEKEARDNEIKKKIRKDYEKISPEKRLAIAAGIGAVGTGALGGSIYSLSKKINTAGMNHKINTRTVRTINAAKRRAKYNYDKKGMSGRRATAEAISTIHRRQAKIATKSVRNRALRDGLTAAKHLAIPVVVGSAAGYLSDKATQAYGNSGLRKGKKKGSK